MAANACPASASSYEKHSFGLFKEAGAKLCYICRVMKTRATFGFYFWFSVPGGREAIL